MSAVQSKVFKVDGFRNPALPEDRRAALEAAEAAPLNMSVEAVLAQARERAGLDDFGPMDFTERLARLLAEVEADMNLWKSAKQTFIGFCVKAAANRLKNQDYLKRHPEIASIKIDRPIFIIGLSRSGTTHLENLIAADRRLRYLPVYLGSEAVPTPGEQPGPDGKDPRWVRADAHWQRMKGNAIMAAKAAPFQRSRCTSAEDFIAGVADSLTRPSACFLISSRRNKKVANRHRQPPII